MDAQPRTGEQARCRPLSLLTITFAGAILATAAMWVLALFAVF